MQVSVEQKSTLERSMTVSVPAERVEQEVEKRLKHTAKTANIAGFRPGKAPLSFIRKQYETSTRGAVFEDLVSKTFGEAIKEQDFKLAGQPHIELKAFEKNKDLEYIANFELFPEIELPDFSQIKLNKIVSDITEQDIDNMLELLRKQATTYNAVESISQLNDRLKIDFVGFMDDKEFAGGSAKDFNLVLGSKQMIAGFEDGLLDKKVGDNVTLNLKFPEDYANEELRGKDVRFEVTIHEVAAPELPTLDVDFFRKFAVNVDNLADFKVEVAKNMRRELRRLIHNKMRQAILDSLLDVTAFEIPKVMIANEISGLKANMLREFSGQQIDAKQIPDDLFSERAKQNVKSSLLLAEIINKLELKADAARVKELVQEVAGMYQEPTEMVNHIYQNERMLNDLQYMALEEQFIDAVLSKAEVTEQHLSYQELTNPNQAN